MVSEPEKSSGVVLPWEQVAIRGDEMPNGLEYPDQVLYLCLRMLYEQKRKGIIDRETAVREKKKLLDEYRCYQFRDQLEKEWVQIIKDTDLARAEYKKNPTIENADKLVAIIEGRKRLEKSLWQLQ